MCVCVCVCIYIYIYIYIYIASQLQPSLQTKPIGGLFLATDRLGLEGGLELATYIHTQGEGGGGGGGMDTFKLTDKRIVCQLKMTLIGEWE